MPPSRKALTKDISETIFVDRSGPKRSFEDAVFNMKPDGCTIRTFYGVGGEGKTALARELFRISSPDFEPSYSNLKRAMLDLHGRPKTDPDLLLVWIRNEFAKTGVSFPAFDLAFAIMWQRTRGEEALPNFENPWLRRTGDILDEAAPDVVAFTRELVESTVETIPLLGFLVTKGSKWVLDEGKKSYLRKTREQLEAFYRGGQLIEAYEMSDILPWMLAQDVNSHVEEHPCDRFVLFIDEYEGVFDGGGAGPVWQENRFDKHLREFIAEANAILAIFFSRERLPWENDPAWKDDLDNNQFALEGLADEDASDWLIQVPIVDQKIREAMIEGARVRSHKSTLVYPLLLELQIAHWKNLRTEAVPQSFEVNAETFESRRRELVQRLLRDYDDPVQQVLVRLSLIQRFDRTVFEHVVNEFHIPIAFEAFDRLSNLSILSTGPDGWLSAHRAVAEAIVAASDQGIVAKSQAVLLEHFTRRANPDHPSKVDATTISCLSEAKSLRLKTGAEGYAQWLEGATRMTELAHRISFLEGLWREALSFSIQALGPKHHSIATICNKIGHFLVHQGKVAEAESLYKQALSIRETILGCDHPNTGSSYNNVASCLQSLGRAVEAEEFCHKAMAICENELGPDHPNTAAALNSLASNLAAQGRPAEAEPLNRRALNICRKVLDSDHPNIASGLGNVASNLAAQGKASEAQPLFVEALDHRLRTCGPDHPDTATSLNNLACNLSALGDHLEAEKLHRKCLTIRDKTLGKDHPLTAESYKNLATTLSAQGRLAEASPFYRGALEIFEQIWGTHHPTTATGYNGLADSLNSQGKVKEAEILYTKALEIRLSTLGPKHPDVGASYSNLAANLDAQGKASAAEIVHLKALDHLLGALSDDHPLIAASYNNVASNLDAQGRHSEAELYYRKALDIFERVLGKSHPDTASTLNNLGGNLM